MWSQKYEYCGLSRLVLWVATPTFVQQPREKYFLHLGRAEPSQTSVLWRFCSSILAIDPWANLSQPKPQ